MSIRFIIGRAGSGKTRRCVQAVQARLREDPLNGPRLLVLVPEQASLQMEREILSGDDVEVSHRAEVLSFQRLAFRVLESTGSPPQQALSEPARAMVLRHLLHKLSSELRYYHSSERLGGLMEQLSHSVSEFIQEDISADQLAGVLDQASAPTESASEAQQTDHVHLAKMHDLHLLYSAYLAYLGDHRLDPSQYLQIARAALPTCHWLSDAELWVDGFASFSRQELLTLALLAGQCASTEITLLDDPAAPPYQSASPEPPLAHADTIPGDVARGMLFRKISRTYGHLWRTFADAGLAIEPPLVLQPQRHPRFATTPNLANLEARLFSVGEPAPAGGAGEGGVENGLDAAAPAVGVAESQFAPPFGLRDAAIRVMELPTIRLEVEYAVGQIRRWVMQPNLNYRYRDMAIIVRDLDPYHDLLTAALRARDIPYFIDKRRTTAHHPIVELLRAAVRLATENMSLEAMRSLLKCGLLPLSQHDIDALENYLLAYKIEGVHVWQQQDAWTFGLESAAEDNPQSPADPRAADRRRKQEEACRLADDARRSIVKLLASWLQQARTPGGLCGRAWATALLEVIKTLQAGQTMADWARQAEDVDGDVDQAEEHRQVWRDTMSFLDDFGFALADLTLSVTQVADVLDAGLAAFTLGLAPPMLDQVMVGSIERSRHPAIKAAIVLGFTDGVFPARINEDPILNDDDRTALSDRGLRLAGTSRQRTLEETLLTYIALTRPSERLVVSYANADSEGKTLRPSPHLDALRQACPGLRVEAVPEPVRARSTWDVQSASDLTGRLALEFRRRPALDVDEAEVRGLWNGLYDAMREEPQLWTTMVGFLPPEPIFLSPTTVERLYKNTLRASVSSLETQASCPFKHYAVQTLRLEERKIAALKPTDIGTVLHAILERFVLDLTADGAALASLDDGALQRRLEDAAQAELSADRRAIHLQRGREAYILQRSVQRLMRVLRAQRAVAAAGHFSPAHAEVAFGFDGNTSLPDLHIDTMKGREVRLRGYIDRVDLARLPKETLGIVIDYKTTRNKTLSLNDVCYGLALQLIGYLLVLERLGVELTEGKPVRPIGAFYVGLTPKYQRVEDPRLLCGEDAMALLLKTFRPRGLLNAADAVRLDRALETDNKSSLFAFAIRKDGEISAVNRSDAAAAADFKGVMKLTAEKLGELGDSILDGEVSVHPYRQKDTTPCTWCPMKAVCRFDAAVQATRRLPPLSRSDVFDLLDA